MAVKLPSKITNQPLQKNWLVLTSIRLNGNRRFVLPMMVVCVCNFIFLKVFDTKLNTDKRMILFRSLENDDS